jgi:DNA-binding transcriptional MerR regulator
MMTTKEMAKRLKVTAATIRNYARSSEFMAPIEEFRGKQKILMFTEKHYEQWLSVLTANQQKKKSNSDSAK